MSCDWEGEGKNHRSGKMDGQCGREALASGGGMGVVEEEEWPWELGLGWVSFLQREGNLGWGFEY